MQHAWSHYAAPIFQIIYKVLFDIVLNANLTENASIYKIFTV